MRAGARGRLRHAGGQKHRDPPPIEVFETLADDAATGDSADPGGPPDQSPSPSPLDDSNDGSNSAEPADAPDIGADIPAEPDGGTADAAPQEPASAAAPSDPVVQSITAAALPLTTTNMTIAQTTAAATPGPGAFELGGFTIWGVDSDTVTAKDFAYDETAKTLTVNTDKHFALRTSDQALSDKEDENVHTIVGAHTNPTSTRLLIPAGREAHITLAGVGIRAESTIDTNSAIDIAKGATCHLVLADGTHNSLVSFAANGSGIHNPTGASLTIDDSVANKDQKGNAIVPEDGFVPADTVLANGTRITKGDPLTVMDSEDPGALLVWCTAGSGAAIGGRGDLSFGSSGEEGGSFTMNGGIVTARSSYNYDAGGWHCSAGIGGGSWGGNGTGLGEWITINGGRLTAIGGNHGAGIGSGNQGACGNIRINGGYVISKGGDHGSGFGAACIPADSSAFKIVLTGGTLIPSTIYPPVYAGTGDIGAPNADITITGGSIGNGRDPEHFTFSGNVHNAAGEPIEMVQVDLTSDVGANQYKITDWQLLVDGEPYPYGAPAEFDKGHLYLWLPKTVKENSEVTVRLTYLDEGSLDKDGNPTPVTPMDLFRPGDNDLPADAPNDGKLRRYADFTLPDSYTGKLTKYYDGEPFPALPLPFEAPDGRNLTDPTAITYKFQMLDTAGEAYGPELESRDPSGASQMPVNAGSMKFTALSTQYSGDTEGHFSESYWGHRAQGKCEIMPIGSQVAITSAVWENGQPGSQENSAEKKLSLTCEVRRADCDPSGEPTKPTCAAPLGRIQLYVDGQAVGEPIEMLTADRTLPDGTVLRANTTAAGDTATFTFTAAPAEVDYLLPVATPNQRHIISAQYLLPNEAQQKAGVPANYLASADPVESPDDAPSAEVAIEPIDPNPTVTPAPDPDCKDPDFPAPSVETGPGEPDDPAADPSEPGDKTYHGSITTTWGEPSKDNPHPGRVTLSIKTPSTGKISVTDASGNVFTADFLKDADGRPVRGEDGTYTLVLDPTAVGSGKLTIRQEANGAYTGSTWVYDVTVNPDVTVAPAPSLSKKAENLTHPDGPTQPGDRIRYTITAANGTAGSLWTGVVVRDPLPACLELDEGSVRLDNPRGGVAGKALTKAPLVAASDVGKFALAAADANGRRVLTVPAGNVPGGAEATITFECTVAADAAGEGAPAADLTNIAEATGTRPDPADPDKPMPDPANPGKPLPIDPDPTDPVTPPGPGRVVPADPEIGLTKTVENLTAPGANVTRIGDRLLYTVTLANTGAANSCLVNAVISDPLPVGIEPAAGTLRLAAGGGASVPVPDGAYDHETRTIAVTCGDIWGGGSAVLTFEAVVEAAALGQSSANIAHTHGSIPSEDPDTVPSNPDPGKPTDPPADEPLASSDPVEPPTIIPDDPGRDDLSIAKTAENASRDDGTTHVGDTVRYCIALANSGPATGWMDAVIRDDVPHGLEPVAGTIRLSLPDGREVAVDDGAYDPATRILAVAVGHLYGGQEAALSFDALVTKDALDTDIGNVGTAFGTPPSQWDPDRPAPAPGDPFRPEEGWDGYIRSHESVSTDPVYPPGVTTRGGILQDADDSSTAREKQRTTIAHKLAQTDDALSLALLLSAALALAAGALALAGRRRARRAR